MPDTSDAVGYSAKIIKDSVNPVGDRLTTFELTYPRMVHAETLTHRAFSRNSASSRAIPTKKLMARVRDYPVMPKWWGKNQRGMQAREELSGDALEQVKAAWLAARDDALRWAAKLQELGLHKQIANRVIEPWMFITVIVTATHYSNWYYLRDDPNAQPEIAWVAHEMRKLHDASTPEELDVGEWHLPYVELKDDSHPLFVSPEEAGAKRGTEAYWLFMAKICAARCARVSYLTHDGVRDLEKDFQLHDRLTGHGHWSPTEHPAEAAGDHTRYGNFVGWRQYRKRFPNEHFGGKML
jgi:thymidylate synthase ThyX